MPPAEISLDTSLRIPEHVVSRTFEEETVLLNLSSGQYHGVNATGNAMIEALREEGTARAVAARMAQEFEMPLEHMEADVVEFVAALLERGLVEVER